MKLLGTKDRSMIAHFGEKIGNTLTMTYRMSTPILPIKKSFLFEFTQ